MSNGDTKAYDIFVSYAHADDDVPCGADYGWVTTFVEELKKILRRKLGGKGASVWMDHALAANDIVDQELVDMVKASRTLVMFLSPGYLQSIWCSKELGLFLETNAAHKNKESVFIVELEPRPREKWHPRLQALTPIQLYKHDLKGQACLLGYPRPPTDADNPYWIQLNSLADSISTFLAQSQPQTASVPKQPVTTPAQPKVPAPLVWIAQPPFEFVQEWLLITEALKQRGVRFLPLAPDVYPRDSAERLRESVQADMREATLLVQLFGDDPGMPLEGGQGTLTTIQATLVQLQCQCRSQLRCMRWRRPDIQLELIQDATYRDLLQGAMACGFEQFRQSVLDAVNLLLAPAPIKPAPQPQAEESLMICVSGGPKDADLCQSVSEILSDLGHTALTIQSAPEPDQSPSEYRLQFEETLAAVSGIILVYGKEASSWVLAKYPQVKKAMDGQGRHSVKGLLDGPPPGKPNIGLAGKDIVRLDCREGVNTGHIESYIERLREVRANA